MIYIFKIVQCYLDCFDLCFNDLECMSFNFWWNLKKCDLNFKVREYSCGICFVKDVLFIYMGMVRYLGYLGKRCL